MNNEIKEGPYADKIEIHFNAQSLREKGSTPMSLEYILKNGEGGIAFIDFLQIIFTAMEHIAQDLISKTPEEHRALARQEFFDLINAASSNLLDMIFPEGLTINDAAILKAQDDLIKEALDRGITPNELITERYGTRVQDLERYREERDKFKFEKELIQEVEDVDDTDDTGEDDKIYEVKRVL